MLFIFDWDGTLCNSISKIVRSLQAAAEAAGEGYLETHHAKQIIGLALPVAIERLFPNSDEIQQGRIAQFYRSAFHSDGASSPLFDGVEDTLNELKARGHRLAVATGKTRFGLDHGLLETGLAERFCATRCADETASKPDPTMLNELLKQLEFSAQDAVMVGDTTFDLEMASAAGMRSLGVSFGSHSSSQLLAHGPELILDSIPELLSWSK